MLPRFELCAEASDEAQAAATGLDWDAFMQLELETDDPFQPPDDRTGHMIFLQEFLLADDAPATTETFDLVRDGIKACLGDIEAGEEGPGYAGTMDVPELGDDSYGVLTTIEEAGGWAEWRLHQVIVRDGPVLMSLVVTDIRAGDDVEPHFTIDVIGDIAQTAVAKIQDAPGPGLANPASVYCVEQGGEVDIVDESDGQVGYCVLPDGRRIEEWEFYRFQTASDEPPTVEELAEGLLTAEDLGDGWVSTMPSGFDGVMTDEMRAEGGDPDLCEEAGDEAAAAMASIAASMTVVASFDLTVDGDDVGSVNITELAFAENPDLVADLSRTVFEGYRTCLAVGPDPDEAVLEARELDLPEIGDDRGFLLSLGDEQDRWDMRTVMVADEPIFVSIAVNEILSDEPVVSDAELTDIVTTAVDKL